MLSSGDSACTISSRLLAMRSSEFNHRSRKCRLHKKRGTPKTRCIVSSCDLTSAIDCKLNHRKTAEPEPCIFSFDFSIHKEKLCSMTCTSEPWPAFVIYLVIYSITASIVSVAWKSMLECIIRETMGTKLFRK